VNGPPPPLAFAAFRDHLAAELDVDLSRRGPGDQLGEDLELDSLQRLEALVAIEELGAYLPDDSVGPEQTLGGLHDLYCACWRSSVEEETP
jgi:acyl carrier protein